VSTTDQLACPQCGKRDDLVISGLSLLPWVGGDPDLKWTVRCWGEACGGAANGPAYHINDAARDELFGTGWRKPWPTPPIPRPAAGGQS
jgi:hypothetical protein